MYKLLDKIIFIRLQAIMSRGLREREIKGIKCLTMCHMLPWRIFHPFLYWLHMQLESVRHSTRTEPFYGIYVEIKEKKASRGPSA